MFNQCIADKPPRPGNASEEPIVTLRSPTRRDWIHQSVDQSALIRNAPGLCFSATEESRAASELEHRYTEFG
jgi:hypothetical protein